jgi:uncharacterized membrane protein (UPF0127 family)
MKRVFHTHMIAICILATGALFGVLFLRSKTVDAEYAHDFLVGDIPITVALANTPAQREQGLSGTRELPEGAGMYFVFDQPDLHGFWMKDMRYPIDIIWINQYGIIIAIDREVSPDTYPDVFYPPTPAKAVLEVPAGFSTAHNIDIGERATLIKSFSQN